MSEKLFSLHKGLLNFLFMGWVQNGFKTPFLREQEGQWVDPTVDLDKAYQGHLFQQGAGAGITTKHNQSRVPV